MIATELDGRVDFTFDAIIVEAEAPGSNNFNQYLDELSRRIAEFAQNRSNIHNALDLLGYAPGVGSFADLANAGLYLYEGNYKESLYSGLAAAPGMGDAFAAARTAKRVENAVQGLSKAERPSWRQSEKDASTDYPGYREQISFKNGEEVKRGTTGSSRPDLYIKGHGVEVKNYNVSEASNRSNLVNIVSEQVNKRVNDLPADTKQSVMIDVRGQDVSKEVLRDIKNAIDQKTGGAAEIIFKTDN